MQFTFLVVDSQPVGRTAPRGKVSAVKHEPSTWGRREGPPRFARVMVDLVDEKEARIIARGCRYDFETGQFCFIADGEPFESSDVIRDPVFIDSYERDGDLAGLLIRTSTGNACDDLLPSFTTRDGMRKYWWDRVWPWRKNVWVRRFLETVRYGSFSDTRDVLRKMPKSVREVFLGRLTVYERRYLKAVCLADNKDEYDDFLVSG